MDPHLAALINDFIKAAHTGVVLTYLYVFRLWWPVLWADIRKRPVPRWVPLMGSILGLMACLLYGIGSYVIDYWIFREQASPPVVGRMVERIVILVGFLSCGAGIIAAAHRDLYGFWTTFFVWSGLIAVLILGLTAVGIPPWA